MYTNTIDHLEFRKFIKKSFVNGTQPAYHSDGFACPPLQAQLQVQLKWGAQLPFRAKAVEEVDQTNLPFWPATVHGDNHTHDCCTSTVGLTEG